jgi:hypothetical protein
MRVHANAKLGPAGRLALVRRIDEGESLRTAAEAMSRLPQRIGGGIAGWKPTKRSAQAVSGCGIARAGRGASRVISAPTSRRGSVRFGKRRVGGHGWSPARPDIRARRSGRCSLGTASRAGHALSAESPTATNGRAPATCCTWTSAAIRASAGPGTARPAIRSQRDRHWMNPATRVGQDYAHAIIDDHSRLAYVELHDDERAATVTGFVERRPGLFRRPRHHRPPRHDRQRLHLRQEPLAARATHRPGNPSLEFPRFRGHALHENGGTPQRRSSDACASVRRPRTCARSDRGRAQESASRRHRSGRSPVSVRRPPPRLFRRRRTV